MSVRLLGVDVSEWVVPLMVQACVRVCEWLRVWFVPVPVCVWVSVCARIPCASVWSRIEAKKEARQRPESDRESVKAHKPTDNDFTQATSNSPKTSKCLQKCCTIGDYSNYEYAWQNVNATLLRGASIIANGDQEGTSERTKQKEWTNEQTIGKS